MANKVGRPQVYSDDDIQNRIGAIAAWKRSGLTNEEIAHNLGIAVSTLYEYQAQLPELKDALKASREEANAQVENALHREALKGNIAAMIFWLKNRKGADWKDKQEFDHNVQGKLTVEKIEERQKTGFLKFFKGAT